MNKNVSRAAGISVIELLSVVAIISILASLLASSLLATRMKARQAKCINNQYQLAKAMLLFATDTEKFPTTLGQLDGSYIEEFYSASKTDSLEASALFTSDYYDNVLEIKNCPDIKPNSDGTMPNSYGLNLYITNQNLGSVTNPSETVLTADSDVLYLESAEQGAKRHIGGIIASFADGHAEWLINLKPFTAFTSADTEPPPGEGPPPVLPPFRLNGGTVILNEDAVSHVSILSAPYADQGQSNWFEVCLDVLVTLPGGEQIVYNLVHNEHGVTGAMNRSQLEGFSWDSAVLVKDSAIDIQGTSKTWSRDRQRVNGKNQMVWTPHINSQYSTQDNFGTQVWVLHDGDMIPTIPGTSSQIAVGTNVESLIQVGDDGLKRVNIGDNQVIYFFEMGETSPYLPGGQVNPNYTMNDLVVLMDVNPQGS